MTPLQFLSFMEIFPVVRKDGKYISRRWGIYLKIHLPQAKKYCRTQDFFWALYFIISKVCSTHEGLVWVWKLVNFFCDSGINKASFGSMSTKKLLNQFAIFPWSIIPWPSIIFLLGKLSSWFCSPYNLLDYVPRFLYIV